MSDPSLLKLAQTLVSARFAGVIALVGYHNAARNPVAHDDVQIHDFPVQKMGHDIFT
jgi:hypothetical protein